MNIYIINLANAHERAVFQEKQFSRLGLIFERVNAVCIDDVGDEYYGRVAFDWERPLSRAEVSCYLSHKSLWQRVINENEPALILEDDAYVCDDFPQLLNDMSVMPVNYINLETRGRKKVVSKNIEYDVCGYKFRHLYYGGTGAAAYLLWPEGARRLLAIEKRSGFALADAQICRTRMGGALQVDCAAAIQLDCCDRYQIDAPHRTASALAKTRFDSEAVSRAKYVFKGRRLVAQLRLGFIQLRAVLGMAVRKEILPNPSKFSVGDFEKI
jgi:glycosyl transferase, family 25